jgi:hypothetical protein
VCRQRHGAACGRAAWGMGGSGDARRVLFGRLRNHDLFKSVIHDHFARYCMNIPSFQRHVMVFFHANAVYDMNNTKIVMALCARLKINILK